MKFSEKLEAMNACPVAVKWVGRRGLMTAWRDCPRPEWMLWLARKTRIDHNICALTDRAVSESGFVGTTDDSDIDWCETERRDADIVRSRINYEMMREAMK